ncbi:MAG: permease-like cell division protein FtsX [Bacilli bacterium]|nr:permease-like cell division protein FtsX [Bacilli bacterium]
MRAIRILFRSIRDAFKSVFRNFSLSIASIICITITLILVAISLVLSSNVNHFTASIEKELTIVVYLSNDIDSNKEKDIENQIRNMSSFESLVFKSKDEWKKEMQESLGELDSILEDMEDNPLFDSLLVKVKNVSDLSATTDKISEIDGVYSATYGKDSVDQMISIFRVIEKVALVIVIALIVVTAFLISNTIRLAIYARRSEIEIMRLVGTSNIAIKLPFEFEGLFLGILGSIIPVLLTIYAYILTYDFFDGHIFSHMIELVSPNELLFFISIILVIIGGVVGMLGSHHAVRKYLKI